LPSQTSEPWIVLASISVAGWSGFGPGPLVLLTVSVPASRLPLTSAWPPLPSRVTAPAYEPPAHAGDPPSPRRMKPVVPEIVSAPSSVLPHTEIAVAPREVTAPETSDALTESAAPGSTVTPPRIVAPSRHVDVVTSSPPRTVPVTVEAQPTTWFSAP